ncbi:hypothetical protein PT974_01920 [Cladobotryum mycophilum]|uniref:LysM domain-containing protein n=1 Tax=Cladobotryum mycophilum TaxID=491253 RepID=A0ABR0SWP4_9HYPO
MSRSSRHDAGLDEERLPDGMTRVGYDADTQIYTFQDADGSYWESAPGSEYGLLTHVGNGSVEDAGDSVPFLSEHNPRGKPSWRHDMMPFLNFGVLVGLCMLVFFWFLYRTPQEDTKDIFVCPGSSLTVQQGDTCWDVAEKKDISVEDLVSLNTWLNCDKLIVGSILCLPE